MNMNQIDWAALSALPVPATIKLADGVVVPHEVGTAVFNYYDHKPGTIERTAERAQPDTSGLLPDGAAWWVDVRHDDGSSASLDGSRMVSVETAKRRGWMT
jgi:hypothetical protein